MIGSLPNFPKIFQNFVLAILVLGCTWQVYEITFNYTKFDVLTSVQIKIDRVKKAKSMIICFNYDQVFNWTKLEQKLDKKLSSNARTFEFPEIFANLTVQELMDITYDDLILFGEYVRLPWRRSIRHRSRTESSSSTRTSVFRRVPSSSSTSTRSKVTSTFRSSSQATLPPITFTTLPSSRNGYGTWHPLSWPWATDNRNARKEPFLELLYTDRTVINSLDGHIAVSSYAITYGKLPHPYTDKCVEYIGCGHQVNCFLDCVSRKTMDRFKLLSPLALHCRRAGHRWITENWTGWQVAWPWTTAMSTPRSSRNVWTCTVAMTAWTRFRSPNLNLWHSIWPTSWSGMCTLRGRHSRSLRSRRSFSLTWLCTSLEHLESGSDFLF